MSQHQTLAVGQEKLQEYESIGFQGRDMIPPPEGLCALILGMSNSGKSYFLQSCQNTFVFNLDLSSTVYPGCPANIWPGLDEGGRPIDPVHGIITLDWPRILEKKATLLSMAADQWPKRPRTVAIDSTNSALRLVVPYVCENAPSLGLGSAVVNLKQIAHGGGWDACYTQIINLVTDLRNAGYGVYLTLHLVNKIIQTEDQPTKEFIDVTITDNFWSRLFPIFELIGAVFSRREVISTPIPRTTPDGKPLPPTYDKQVVKKRYLIVDPGPQTDTTLHRLVKPRIAMPGEIELPAKDPWGTFTKTYMEAATIRTPSLQEKSNDAT